MRIITSSIIFVLVIIAIISFSELVNSPKFIRASIYTKTFPIVSRGVAEGEDEMIFCNTVEISGQKKVIYSQELYQSKSDSVIVILEETIYQRGKEVYGEIEIVDWRLE